MNGRIENELKLQKRTENKLANTPYFVKEWYVNLKASRKTASSINDYVNKIVKFLYFINNDINSVDISEINSSSVESYYISIQTKNRNGEIIYTSDSYQQTIWCALNSFLEFLYKRNYIDKNYIKDISKPKNQDLAKINNKRILLTDEDFNKILNSTNKGVGSNKAKKYQSKLKNRDILIMLIFMTTGMRKTALSEINIEDVDLNKKVLTIIDKGNKCHTYYINDELLNYFNLWLYDRKIILLNNKLNNNALFITEKGNRLTGVGIYQLVEKYCEDALNKKISPHKLRSGFCSILYNKTHDAEFVRRAVGHSNISTTQRYIRTDNKEKEQASNIMNNILNI